MEQNRELWLEMGEEATAEMLQKCEEEWVGKNKVGTDDAARDQLPPEKSKPYRVWRVKRPSPRLLILIIEWWTLFFDHDMSFRQRGKTERYFKYHSLHKAKLLQNKPPHTVE